jgi:translation elongation factor EF-Tu-like GTPase
MVTGAAQMDGAIFAEGNPIADKTRIAIPFQ